MNVDYTNKQKYKAINCYVIYEKKNSPEEIKFQEKIIIKSWVKG